MLFFLKMLHENLLITAGEDGVTKWNPMLTWVNDSFSQIAGVKWDDETGDSLQHRKGGPKMGRPCKRRFTPLVGYRQA